ncbi:hypothetical protein SPBR_05325 [Sporothrix brasiliensis 5110]|uniref:Uncharacterized protein n=1 Tax=Sporothrix brasiliensis 5110 TaxID=1398154 RepID=A0A0C2IRU0_9PEZI|nr:uncharacterized protein SPBR_05325 [Sporothrix brasiliensis 5110]KIH87707.1 hypothetical protein SPBR_05325 [Sporothrix brasiliensis 5110]
MGCFRTLFPFGKGDAAKTASSEAEQFTDSLAPGQSAQEPPADAQQAVEEATIVETTTAVATTEPATEPATEPVIEQGIEPVIETVAEPVTGLLPAASSASETEPLLTKSSVVRTITA